MTEQLKEKLQSWSSLKNWHSAHPSDEERFFDFIIEAYNENKKNGLHIDLEEFIEIVRDSAKFKLTDKDIEKKYLEYELGISLLMYLAKQ